jgi:tetratricopeptide (TPR) repeat protein
MAREPATSVFWAHASSAARFVEAYQDIGIRAGILERKDATADIMRTVSDWLSSEKSGTWLLIVDNVDDASVLTAPTLKEIAVARSVQQHNPQAKALMSCIPQCQHGSVLVTSRFRKAAHSIVGDYDSLFQVDSLSAPDAVLLLQTKLTLDEEDAACVDDFVRTLELIPLAITQAAAYVHERAPRMTLRRYLQEFARSESNRLTLLDQSAADLRRDPNVSSAVVTTWAISFHQILEQYPSAAELLSLVSVLDSQSVPEFLLNPAEDRGRLAFEDDLAHLLEFAMISLISKDNAIRVHPLVQLAMRSWLEQNGQLSRWKREAIKLLSERFPDASDYNNMQACKQLFPHAEVTAAFEFGDDESLLRVATVLGRVTRYMLTAGYVTTQDRAEWALRIRTGVLGAEHPDTLASVCDLAQVLQNQGKYEAAEEMNRRALEGREKVLGRHHADTLKSVANLAMAMQCQGKYERAEQMNRRAIEGREEMLGPDHADTLSSVSSHAEVLLLQGKYEAAEEMNRRALEGREKVLGHDHPDTLTSVSNLALVLRKQGKYGAAEEMNRRALEEREMMLGPDHPDTLTSVNNLALVLQDQGKYGAAEEMNRRALTGFEKMLGPDHPDTLASIDNLAAVLRRQGKYDAAEEMNRRAMVGYEKVLGPDHPDTLTSVNNLASVLQDQGRYEAAEEMNRRALTGYEKTLGCDHPYTLTSVSVLAVVLRNQGKYDAAEEMNRRALEGREKVLGRDHPHTLASVESLVSVLQCQNKYDAAEEIKRQHKRT